ncbi:uncharacterized protein LOC106172388 isoform X2 [Lingula anatina]|uniref:Uncharacterized protein LOC106172388 isoform X2 n=1 Tax=Lingula anatina TaxID=7574 RepID=A0A1S3JEE1_LINAN|nr:uncharacterized protein LOC106172388 isoform X2 [Lingula anatina]|eukprot:XP_013408526.1 uncharacterized protein LOC106172388 isoform X2 [Lingula anatina]
MARDKFEFHDPGTIGSSESFLFNGSRKSKGCHVSVVSGIILVFLAIAITVGVGLIVHFAGDRVVCNCGTGTDGNGGDNDRQIGVTSKTSPPPITETTLDPDTKQCIANCEAGIFPTCSPGTTMANPGATTPKTPEKVTDVRLPTGLIPVHYKLKLQPDMYGDNPENFLFSGAVEIFIHCQVSTNNITLHINKLTIKNSSLALVEQNGNRVVDYSHYKVDEARQFFILHLRSSLSAGMNYTLNMEFEGPLKPDLKGLYLSQYKRGNNSVYIATTQMQATDARKAFPCFDEPAFKAVFEVTLVRKGHMKSLSNMPQTKTELNADGWYEDHYEPTVKMSTYLLAFVVCDFVSVEKNTTKGTVVKVWSRPEAINQTQYALEAGVAILEYFEAYYDVPYPLPKQDMIAIPDFAAGAMENWGLITYRETALLYDPAVSSLGNKQSVAIIVSHELAHQWFGNLVSPLWWDDLWLNEGFASYVEYLGVDNFAKEFKLGLRFPSIDIQGVFRPDGLASSHPIYVPVGHPDEIIEIFDSISYNKGASIIRMMSYFLTEDTFRKGLTSYLRKHAYDVATHDDLWTSLSQEATGIDVKQVMDTWTLQMGYPVVKIDLDNTTPTGAVRVTQKHFLIDPSVEPSPKYPSPYNYKWEIPLTLTTSKQPRWEGNRIKWMSQTDITLDKSTDLDNIGNSDWVVANIQQYGYYRVNYNKKNWENIIRQLSTDHNMIHVINRAQLIDDAFNIARSGSDPDVDVILAMRTTKHLDKDFEYMPWRAALNNIGYIHTMLSRTSHFGNFKAYMLGLILPLYNRHGWATIDDPVESFSRTSAIGHACAYGHQHCLDEATKLFRQWMNTPNPDANNPIKVDLKSLVYCYAIKNGGQAEWDWAYERYKKANVAAEKSKLIVALTCSNEPWILNRYLEYSMDRKEVRQQDAVSVMANIAGNSIGKSMAWNFFRANWDKIFAEFGGLFSFDTLISSMTGGFNTEFELEQLQALMSSKGNLGSGQRAFEQAVEKTWANIKWMQANEQKLGDWLKSGGITPDPGTSNDVRLPSTLHPVYYKLDLKPDIYGNDPEHFNFSGSVEITIFCNESTLQIKLHSNKLTIPENDVKLMDENGVRLDISNTEMDTENQFFILNLPHVLEKGKNYTLKMKFEGPLKDDLTGLYRSQYFSTAKNKTVHIATTQMQPTDARKAFPCFDEPAFRAVFEVTLWRKDPMKSLSNMPIRNTTTQSGGWIADHYLPTLKMSTYLLAFIICDFDYVENTTSRNTIVRVWARPEAKDQAYYALDAGVRILEYFEGYYNITFPLPKQDMIAIPDFAAGAMENWGLITYRETAVLYDPKVSSAGNKQWVAVVVSHELAHQWFGNLVTPLWWDDLWLNEGFASYVEYLGVDFIEPTFKMMEQFLTEALHDVFGYDGLANSHPIYVPVGHPDEINEIFDTISYSKGASIIRMMSHFLTEDLFRRGLTHYLNRHAYDVATHDDLWNALTEQTQKEGELMDVKTIMDTWTLQMGYPVVKINRDYSGHSATVTQSHFLIDPTVEPNPKYPSPFNYKWEVPLTFTTSVNPQWGGTDIRWMHKNDANFMLNTTDLNNVGDDGWVIGNLQQYGYYRVNYDRKNWDNILSQLQDDHTKINVKNRAQIIDDVFNIGSSGMDSDVDIVLAMETTKYLVKEVDYIPWETALISMGQTDRMLSKTGLYGNYQKYMLGQILPLYNKVGWEDTGDHIEQYNRINALSKACDYGHQPCRDKASEMFTAWMRSANPDMNNPIAPNLKSLVYCNAIKNGGSAEWNFAYERYKKANVASEQSKLLYGLSCSTETWILSRYLDYALTPTEVRKQDATSVIRYVARNPIGRCLAWDFIREKWTYIIGDYGSGWSFSGLIDSITGSFNTQFELDQLNAFISSHDNLGSGQRAFEQAVEKTQANIKWMQANEKKLGEWLAANVDPTDTITKPSDVRLPTTMLPNYYKLWLRPDIYGSDPETFTFDGVVEITMLCNETTKVIKLHTNKLTINSVELMETANNASVGGITRSEDKSRQFLVINAPENFVVGKNYTLKINFTGPLKDDLAGLYRSQYFSSTRNETIHIATTQMQPTDARKAFPCFDEPAFKAVFEVTLWRKEPMISLSNMPIRSTTTQDDWKLDHYFPTVKMPTYLLAFIICDFVYVERNTTRNTAVRVWARPEAKDQTTYALDAGVEILEYFEEYYNINFPLPKQDMIAIPDFAAGAMENWGLITYRETALLYDPKVSSASNKQRVAVVVSHELAHQWFGNLVSPLWWDDLWLNEGFASYVEYLGVDFFELTWKMMEQFLVEDLEDVFKLDGLANSHPIYVPVGHPDEINEIFDRISYAKGASIIRMMNNFLTEEVFKKGLTRYLNRHAYDVATHDDLWAALSEQTREDGHSVDVKTIMDTWTLQMGYPVVKINRTYSEQPSTVSQSHFLIDPTVEPNPKYPSPFNYKWEIPLTLTTSNSPMWNGTIRWMNKNDISLNTTDLNNVGDDGWVIGNLQQYGYYRVNYDRKNWENILNQLNTNHRMIHVKNRAQIIDDAFNIANSGIDPAVDIDLAMQTTKYLSKETEYIPWEAALLNVGYLDIMMSKTQHYGNYQKYMLRQILPLYNRVGWEDTEGHLEQYNKINALGRACAYGYQPCLDKATEMFNSWMNSANPDEDNPIPPNLKSLVYCNAIKKGTSQLWDWTYERYKKANVASEQVKLLYGLSCSSQTWILSRYLEYAITSSEIRKQDGTSVIVYVARNHIGRGLAWDFIRSKWNFLMNDYGGGSFSFSSIIRGVTTHFNTQFELEKLNEFISSRDNLGSGQRAFEQAVEKTQANIKWMEANEQKLGDWLAANVDSTDLVTKPTDVRLPADLMPSYYKLELRPDIYQDDPKGFNFSGKVDITMHCNNATNVIKLHIKSLTIDGVELVDMNGLPVPYTNTEEDKSREFFIVNLPQMLVQGMNYTLTLNFSGPLRDDLVGLYWSQYFSSMKNKTVHIATSQLAPTDARKVFPCFDEPAIKAEFEVILLRKSHMKSLSNMPQRFNQSRGDDWYADHYAPTVKMSTYLLAFVVCDFDYVENTTANGTKVRVWARPEAMNQTLYALQAGVRILGYFERYYAIDYPLPKQDMIAIPDFAAGAMENWGLITYRETALLYDPKVSSASNKQRVAVVVSHELAHQWFGNLVTPLWWDDIWLNEGFASYVEYLGVDYIEPTWKMMEQFLVEDLEYVFKLDGLASSHPIYVPVGHPDEINEIFDRISYSKGASIIRMMSSFLTEDTFKKGLTLYLNKHAYDVATHDDLWNALSTQTASEGRAIDVKSIMDTWTLQMGYPVVKVDVQTRNVTQMHFLQDPSATPDPKYDSSFNYKWYVPLTLTSSQHVDWNSQNIIWMNLTDVTLTSADMGSPDPTNGDWVIANLQQFGYYRVNYDLQNWQNILTQLSVNHAVINVKNRAQLIDDAFSVAGSGIDPDIDVKFAMKTTLYLVNETEYLPWNSAITNLDRVDLLLSSTGYYGFYQKYMLKQILPLYEMVGWEDNGDQLMQYNRINALNKACSYGHQPCLDNATTLFNTWKLEVNPDEINPITPNLKSTVYCNAIENGGQEEWDWMYERYKKANVATERSKLLVGLSCSREPFILSRYLSYSLNSAEIRRQDGPSVIGYIARNPIGRLMAWDFMQSQWDKIMEIYGKSTFSFPRIIKGVTSTLTTPIELQQVEAFVKRQSNLGTGERAFQQGIEEIKANVAWIEKNAENVGNWLKENTST